MVYSAGALSVTVLFLLTVSPGIGPTQAQDQSEPARQEQDEPATEERDEGGDIGVAVEGDRISVHAEEASLRDVLTVIAAETGLALSIQGQHDRAVTVRLDRVPLLEALDRIVRNDYVLAGNRLLVFLGPVRASHAPGPGETAPQEPTIVPEPATAPAPGTPVDAPPPGPGADAAGTTTDTETAPAEPARP